MRRRRAERAADPDSGSTARVAELERLLEAQAAELAQALDAQRDAERRHRTLVEELPLTVYIDRPHQAALAGSDFVSRRAEEMFGYPATSWHDDDFFLSIVHPDDRDRIRLEHEQALADAAERWSFEYRIIHADGQTVWVRDEAVLVKDADGTPRYVQGFIIDVTSSTAARAELTAALEDLQETERRYRQLVEELPLAVYTDKPDSTSTSTYISPRVEELFGYPPEAWMEEPFFHSVIHPADRERVISNTEKELSAVASDRWSEDYRIIAADGRTVWVRDDAWVVRDQTGAPTHVQGFLIDITEQTEAAAELRRQKQYFESLVAISPAAVVTMNPEEQVTGWNPAAERLFGFTAAEAVGRPIDELILRTDEVRADGISGDEVLMRGLQSLISQRMRKNGSLVDVEIAMISLVVDGEHLGFYAVYHDISELQAARRAADAANEAKGAFLAAMSHEIRTPLNAVIGMGGLLLDTDLDPDQRELASTVRSSSEALLTLINDILDFSKIEAGATELEEVPYDVRACVAGALSLVGSLAAAKGLALSHDVADEVPRAVVGDAGRVRQVLINVLSNAVKFTDTGSVDLSVRSTAAPDGRVTLGFSVRDTGIGLRPDRLGRLFQSFSQEDASISRRYGGTGLGLAISKGLAEAMGGSMWAESDGPGQGSTFHITIRSPVAEQAPEAITEEVVELDPGLATRHPLRILVAEDNVVNQKLVLRLLERMGYTADVAVNGREAVEAIGREPYDLVLMDVQMPEMDGLRATREIRARLEDGRPRIVAMTANATDDDRHRCLDAGMDGYVTKPLRVSALVSALREAPTRPWRRRNSAHHARVVYREAHIGLEQPTPARPEHWEPKEQT